MRICEVVGQKNEKIEKQIHSNLVKKVKRHLSDGEKVTVL